MLPLTLWSLLLLPSLSHAFNFPFKIDFNFRANAPSPIPPHRVAIIGAGAGGSSAAFWLARAQNRTPEHQLEIEIFEKESYIGGSELHCAHARRL